jgi:hypothetical protein
MTLVSAVSMHGAYWMLGRLRAAHGQGPYRPGKKLCSASINRSAKLVVKDHALAALAGLAAGGSALLRSRR